MGLEELDLAVNLSTLAASQLALRVPPGEVIWVSTTLTHCYKLSLPLKGLVGLLCGVNLVELLDCGRVEFSMFDQSKVVPGHLLGADGTGLPHLLGHESRGLVPELVARQIHLVANQYVVL